MTISYKYVNKYFSRDELGQIALVQPVLYGPIAHQAKLIVERRSSASHCNFANTTTVKKRANSVFIAEMANRNHTGNNETFGCILSTCKRLWPQD
jgi:hypothetical protein